MLRALARTHVITGGAGFIGSHLADALVARGESVLILDDLSSGCTENIEDSVRSGRAELARGSVLDRTLVEECVREAVLCFHLASPVGVRLVLDRPLQTLVDGSDGARAVAEACAAAGCRLVFVSTSEICGKGSSRLLAEDADRVLGPTTVSRWN